MLRFLDVPLVSLHLFEMASWRRLFYRAWQVLSSFSGFILVSVVKVRWGWTAPVWALSALLLGWEVYSYSVTAAFSDAKRVVPAACLALLCSLLGHTGLLSLLHATYRLWGATHSPGSRAQPSPSNQPYCLFFCISYWHGSEQPAGFSQGLAGFCMPCWGKRATNSDVCSFPPYLLERFYNFIPFYVHFRTSDFSELHLKSQTRLKHSFKKLQCNLNIFFL